ncbi:MAG: hypothetical protein QM764_21790 [Chitinophagaceae bacterium]
MNTTYCIKLSLRCGDEVECIAKFNLGNDKQFAKDLFGRLKGSHDVQENDPLQMEFIETKNELPLSMQIISCTLADLGENAKMITREVFKSKLLMN